MEIAVVDDDKDFMERIKTLIQQICFKNNIQLNMDVFFESKNIVKKLYNSYQVIFLDIDMPEINGIELAEKLNILKGREEIPIIVFITGKDHLVFDALQQFPYSFIRKSHMDEEFEKCIIKIYHKLKYEKTNKYSIKVGRNTVLVNANDIICLEKENNYVKFYTDENVYKERTNMDVKEGELRDKNFIRVHLGYLVNMIHIAEITKNTVILDNGKVIPLGRKYKSTVPNIYFEWMVKHNAWFCYWNRRQFFSVFYDHRFFVSVF